MEKQSSPHDLNQMAIQGKIICTKEEKLDNGFYCGTWYHFYNKDHSFIHSYFSSAGFGLSFDKIQLKGSIKTQQEMDDDERLEREAEVAFHKSHPELNP
jgi:hypothetical protein